MPIRRPSATRTAGGEERAPEGEADREGDPGPRRKRPAPGDRRREHDAADGQEHQAQDHDERRAAKIDRPHERRHRRVALQEEPADTRQDVEFHAERRQNQGYARSAQERGAPGAGLGTRCREAGVEGWQHAEQQHEPDQREIVRHQPPRRRHRSARPGQGLGWRPRIEGEERSHEWECSKGETRESEGHGCPSHRGLPPATSSQGAERVERPVV